MVEDETKETYSSLRRLFRDLERNLKDGESIGVQSQLGPEFFVQKIQRNGTLVMIVGDTADGDLEKLIFSPSNVSVRLLTSKRQGKTMPIGFHQSD